MWRDVHAEALASIRTTVDAALASQQLDSDEPDDELCDLETDDRAGHVSLASPTRRWLSLEELSRMARKEMGLRRLKQLVHDFVRAELPQHHDALEWNIKVCFHCSSALFLL